MIDKLYFHAEVHVLRIFVSLFWKDHQYVNDKLSDNECISDKHRDIFTLQ